MLVFEPRNLIYDGVGIWVCGAKQKDAMMVVLFVPCGSSCKQQRVFLSTVFFLPYSSYLYG